MSTQHKRSKLTGDKPVMSKSDSLPMLKITSRQEDILIPSVKVERSMDRSLDRSNSRKSDRSLMDDSRSLESFSTLALSNNKGVKGPPRSLRDPVKMVGRKEMQVEVPLLPEELPSKLDMLEAMLPRALRNEQSAARKRLQLQHESDQKTLFNIVRTSKGPVGTASAASVGSYQPVHYASGDYSATSSVVSELEDELDRPRVRLGSEHGSRLIMPANQHRQTLWETTYYNGMQAREEIKRQVEEAEALARSSELADAIVHTRAQIKEKTIQKVKALNEVLKNKINLQEAIEASGVVLAQLPHIRHKKAAGVSDYAIQNETLHMDLRNPTLKPDEEIDYAAFERAQMPAFKQRVIAVKNNGEDGEEVSYYSKELKSVASMGESFSEDSLSSEVLRGLHDLGASEIKAKLKDLAQYINSHTSRKILDAWYLIEGRFKSSTHSKSVIEIDANGLAHPVKHPAVPLSALAYILCSTRIKVGHEELQKICNRLGFITPEHAFHARQIAAVQVLLAMNDEVQSEHYEEFKQELWQLSKGGEPLVSLQEFTDVIFPEDPEEREAQFALIRNSRQLQVQTMMDEKRTKATMKQRAAARKKQMIDDFTIALSTLQVTRSVLTQAKVTEFTEMIEKCKEYIERQKEDEAVNVPQDLVLFLGLEAFPQLIQEKIIAKREAREAQRRSRRFSDITASTANSERNPFSKENLAKKIIPKSLLDDGSVRSGADLPTVAEGSTDLPPASAADGTNRMSHSSRVTGNGSSSSGAVRVRVPAYKRVLIAGPPPMLDVMKEMVSFGRGLHGLSYRESVSVLQALAATKLSSMFRCFRKRWRYTAARRMWITRFNAIRSKHLLALRTLVQRTVNTRNRCWRKLMAWRFYTKRAIDRRKTFRIAFWPFYVWHRYADAKGKAKDKATFLVGRVMPTLTTIKVFKAWKAYAKVEARLNRTADKFFGKLQRADMVVLVRWMHEWAHKRHAIRRAWNIKGNEMRLRYVSRLVLSPFYTWRTYTNYRKITRGRAQMQQHQFRRVLLKNRPPRHSLSNSQRRVAMKVAELKRRVTARRVSQDELKDKLKKRQRAKRDAQRKTSRMGGSPTGYASESVSEDESSVGTSRLRASNTRTGSVAVEVPADFHDAVAALYVKPDFRWDLDTTEIYDVDIDQEDEDGLTPLLLGTYQQAHIRAMQEPESFAFYDKMSDPMVDHAALVRELYTYADHWNAFESSFRFHFFGYRAFKNMQHFAVQRRRVRIFMKVRLQRIKQQIMNELRKNLEARNRRNAAVKGSEAERISHAVRAHQVAKVVRTRKFTAEVNSALGRDHDDVVDDEAARLNRIRQLNLIDPDDEEYLAKEKKRLEERQAELRRQQQERDKRYQPPNLLEIDRKDRELEDAQAEEMVSFSRATREKTEDLVKASDEITEAFRDKLARTGAMVKEVLDSESAVTTRAQERQEAYMKEFKVHAAGQLVNKLLKVYLEVQMSLMKEESKVYFRCLRLPMLLTRSKSMYYRKKLMNWIRICRRLNSISRNAHYYQATRTKWVIFNRWLKYIAIEKLNPTPGLVPYLRRKTKLIPDFDAALERDGFEKSVYVDNTRLQQATAEFGTLFSRWKMFTQEEALFRLLNEKVRVLHRLQLLQKCFWAIKTGLDTADYMNLIRQDAPIFPLVRARADIEQLSKRFINVRRKSISTVVRRNNRKYVQYIIKDGQTSMSFKRFMTQFVAATNSRISTEQRIISDYFEDRGTQQFTDVQAPDRDHPIVPPIMAKVTGRGFADPHEISADGRSIAVPGGYKLSKIKFAFQHGVGIIGWQLFWTADGAKELESPQRGSWTSASLGANEFIIPKDDFVIGLEYLYDSDVIVGVRLRLLLGGFTKWIGGKTSLSTLGVYMDCENCCPREEYEDVRDNSLHSDEKKNPAYPYNFVIGLTGVVTAGRTTRLGLVVRKVMKQNLFSYTWVGDAIWKQELERSEAVAEQTLPSLDMYTIPTHLSGFVAGPPIGPPAVDGGDSLTMSHAISSTYEGSVDTPQHRELDNASVGSMDDSFPGSSTVNDDDESIDSQSQASQVTGLSKAEPLPPPKSRGRRMGFSNPVVARLMRPSTQSAQKEPLTSSEVQFFDVLRMRTTELSHARSRAVEFARNLWTNKLLRLDNELGKLVVIRIVRGLTMWYFNALSKRLLPQSHTEKSALKLLRNAKTLLSKADSVRNRVNQILMNADVLESSAQIWTGKHLLSPKERALKAAHHQKIANMRAEAAKVKRDENFLRLQAVIDEKRGMAQMPQLPLTQYIVNNYRLKLAAARHKESLLERMTLDDIKNGLFGTNLKEKLLSKEQMQAIHESLRSQQLKLKDVTSLERLIDNVVEEEGELAAGQTKRSIALPPRSVRQTALAEAASLQRTKLDPHLQARRGSQAPTGRGDRKLSESVALRLNSASLVNHRSRTPLVMTDRIGSPELPSLFDNSPQQARSYSIMEFSPLILPDAGSTSPTQQRRRTSPNQRRTSTSSHKGATAQPQPQRANTVMADRNAHGKYASPPRGRPLITFSEDEDDD